MKNIMLRRAMASFFVFLIGGLGAVADVTSENGSLFDPNAATEVNDAVTVANGESITFNTDDLAIGGDYSGDGEQAISESGNVTLAMFTFKRLTIEEGATVTVTGSRGLVLASRKDMTVETNVTINLSGQHGLQTSGGDGGPGGYAGGVDESDGSGPGAGGRGKTTTMSYGGGGGGGYGGNGGRGSSMGDHPDARGTGGSTYVGSDTTMAELYGGSGGGGGAKKTSSGGRGAGGGGGAIALIAAGTLTFDGTILVKGGNGDYDTTTSDGYFGVGGGGSGGGVILCATTLAGTGTISARGGDGRQARYDSGNGGGGGGGRVALYYDNNDDLALSSVVVNGGGVSSGGYAQTGDAGTYNANAGECPFDVIVAGTVFCVR